MHHLSINWSRFFDYAAKWEKISLPSRQSLIELTWGNYVQVAPFATELELLINDKFLTPSADPKCVRLHDDAREFSRALRAMARHPIFASPSQTTLTAYIRDNLSKEELECFSQNRFAHGHEHATVQRATSDQWANKRGHSTFLIK